MSEEQQCDKRGATVPLQYLYRWTAGGMEAGRGDIQNEWVPASVITPGTFAVSTTRLLTINNIERYELVPVVVNRGENTMALEPAPDGPWVRFEDAAAISNRLASMPSATPCSDDIEKAWQMLEVCGVPRERARNNLARGIEVLSSRLAKEEWFQKAMEADAARWRWMRDGHYLGLDGEQADRAVDKVMANNRADGGKQT